MKVSKLFVAAIATAMVAGTAQAQATMYSTPNANSQTKVCDVTLTASCTVADLNTTLGAYAQVNDILRLTVGATVVDLGTPSEADFNAGGKDAAGQTQVTIKSNRPATVSIAAGGANWKYTGTLTNPNKLAGDLLYGSATDARTSVLSTTPAAFITSTTGTSAMSKDLYLHTNWAYGTDVPGNYSLDIKFTVSAP
jgi:hypothetical protein